MNTILDPTPHFTPDSAHQKQGTVAAKAKRQIRNANQHPLEGGAVAYEDAPPGLGYVLLLPNGWKKYYRWLYQARAFWFNVYKPLFDAGKTEKHRKGYYDAGRNPLTGTYTD